jgi:hypothetical protein
VEKQKITLTAEKGCLGCLNYFAIFRYPLTAEEIHRYNTVKSSRKEVNDALDRLISKKLIFKLGDFYLPGKTPDWVEERKTGNQRAKELLKQSAVYVNIIARFPFVRGIAISGSLSKFYATKEADIDYFIITAPNRLWIARTLLHLFKKLTFLTGHQHYFCMNYFVDTNSLQITHQNLYSAIETVTLLPVYNAPLIGNFMLNNDWVTDYLPNYNTPPIPSYLIKSKPRYIKRFVESLFNLLAPGKLNRFLMRLTDRKWRSKWEEHNYSEEDYNRAFQTEISISKNHPADFEKKVLNQLATTTNKTWKNE